MKNRLIRQIGFFFLGLAILLAGTLDAKADVVANIYSGHTTTGGGTPYSGFVGSLTSPDIMFGTNTGWSWHPFGLDKFGADINGSIMVPAAGNYTFQVLSDDGALLFIDGSLVVDHGGPALSGYDPIGVAFLSAGLHPFEVQFFEDFGDPSGVDVILDPQATYSEVPLPSTLLLLGSGLLGLLALGRRKIAWGSQSA